VNYLVDLDFVRRWGAAINHTRPLSNDGLSQLPGQEKQPA